MVQEAFSQSCHIQFTTQGEWFAQKNKRDRIFTALKFLILRL